MGQLLKRTSRRRDRLGTVFYVGWFFELAFHLVIGNRCNVLNLSINELFDQGPEGLFELYSFISGSGQRMITYNLKESSN